MISLVAHGLDSEEPTFSDVASALVVLNIERARSYIIMRYGDARYLINMPKINRSKTKENLAVLNNSDFIVTPSNVELLSDKSYWRKLVQSAETIVEDIDFKDITFISQGNSRRSSAKFKSPDKEDLKKKSPKKRRRVKSIDSGSDSMTDSSREEIIKKSNKRNYNN